MATRNPNRLTPDGGASSASDKTAGKRPAPPIAAQNADAARRNITTKLDILRDFLALSAGELQSASEPATKLTLADLPRSVRQFNSWNSSALRPELKALFSPFSNNSHATLKKSAALYELTLDRLNAIKNVAKPSSVKQESRAALLRQISLANRLRIISEKALIRSRRELADERSKIEGLEGEIVNTTAKFREELSSLKREVSTLKAENARLAALVKASPKLRSV